MSEMTTYRLDQAGRRAEMIELRMSSFESKLDGIDTRRRAVGSRAMRRIGAERAPLMRMSTAR